jgi:hypothetical protein
MEGQTSRLKYLYRWQAYGLLFSMELLDTGVIQNFSFWKIACLKACNFQGNSWILGASISFSLWENCRGFAPAILRGTLGSWGFHKFK